MKISRYFPFLATQQKTQSENQGLPNLISKIQGKISSSRFRLQHLDNPNTLPPKKKELYNVAIEFQSIFVKLMLNSMRKTLKPKDDLLYGGRVQEVFEDLLYDEYAKIYSKNANIPLAEELYFQLEKYIKDDSKGITHQIKEKIIQQRQFLNHIEGIISTDQLHTEWKR